MDRGFYRYELNRDIGGGGSQIGVGDHGLRIVVWQLDGRVLVQHGHVPLQDIVEGGFLNLVINPQGDPLFNFVGALETSGLLFVDFVDVVGIFHLTVVTIIFQVINTRYLTALYVNHLSKVVFGVQVVVGGAGLQHVHQGHPFVLN